MTKVNVQDFGAIGVILTTTGRISTGPSGLLDQLTVDNISGWKLRAGVGIPGAAADGTALVTRVTSIIGNVLTLLDSATSAATG